MQQVRPHARGGKDQLLACNRLQAWCQFEPEQMAEGKTDSSLTMAIDVLALDFHVGAVAEHPSIIAATSEDEHLLSCG